MRGGKEGVCEMGGRECVRGGRRECVRGGKEGEEGVCEMGGRECVRGGRRECVRGGKEGEEGVCEGGGRECVRGGRECVRGEGREGVWGKGGRDLSNQPSTLIFSTELSMMRQLCMISLMKKAPPHGRLTGQGSTITGTPNSAPKKPIK